MPRAPQQIKDALTAASERRADLHHEMVTGALPLDRYRELLRFEERWIDTLLDELHRALTPA